LIRLCDELLGEHPDWELRIGGDSVGLGIPGDLCGGVGEVGLDRCVGATAGACWSQ
jgi:hypothetical protein